MIKNRIISDENGRHWESEITPEMKSTFIGEIHYTEPEEVAIYFQSGDENTHEYLAYKKQLEQEEVINYGVADLSNITPEAINSMPQESINALIKRLKQQ